MTNALQITDETTPRVITEIEQAFFDIPFENSDFQTENFVLAAQLTPERAYRTIGLRMFQKIQALQETQFKTRESMITVMEMQEKIDNPATSKFDRMRAELEIEKIHSSQAYTNKLKNDAIHELELLYKYFKALPRYTRDEFEAGERAHFEMRMDRQLKGIVGAAESVVNMTTDKNVLLAYTKQLTLTSPSS